MAAQISTVNLLPVDRFEFSPWGRFLVWVLSTGKIVVVLTELVVIAAFLSRFWFDRRLSDLRELRMARTAAVKSMGDVQARWESAQFLAEEINRVNSNNFDASERLNRIQALTPADVEFDSIEISSQSAALRGYTQGSAVFSKLFFRIKGEKSYSEVIVRKLEQSAGRSPGFDFELELRYQKSDIRS